MSSPLTDPAPTPAPASGSRPFGRADLERGPLERLSEGRWANAVLYQFEHGGEPWVVKDFASRSFIVRNLIGRLLVRREIGGLTKVAGIAGMPAGAFRVDAHALAYRFVPGRTLRFTDKKALGHDFFVALEKSLEEMHDSARIAHLDLRNGHNILVTEDGRPMVLDFQSYLGTRWLPPPLRRFVERIDLAAVYKHWAKRSPETMGTERTAALGRMNRLRPLWVLRGYIGSRRPPRRKHDRRP